MGLQRGSAATAPRRASHRRPRCPKSIKYGSDFSGMDAAAVAMKRLTVDVTVEFASDTDAACRKVLEAVHAPQIIYPDVMGVDVESKPPVDVYVWTPPRQDFSSAGKKKGAKGPRKTGSLMSKSLAYIKAKKPRVAIFDDRVHHLFHLRSEAAHANQSVPLCTEVPNIISNLRNITG